MESRSTAKDEIIVGIATLGIIFIFIVFNMALISVTLNFLGIQYDFRIIVIASLLFAPFEFLGLLYVLCLGDECE